LPLTRPLERPLPQGRGVRFAGVFTAAEGRAKAQVLSSSVPSPSRERVMMRVLFLALAAPADYVAPIARHLNQFSVSARSGNRSETGVELGAWGSGWKQKEEKAATSWRL